MAIKEYGRILGMGMGMGWDDTVQEEKALEGEGGRNLCETLKGQNE